MHRISNGTQTNAIPAPTAVVGLPGYASPGVPGVQAATALDAGQWNAFQEELAGVVEHAGIALDKANNAQLLAALTTLFSSAGGLAAEVAARAAGDAALNGDIGAEAAARAAEDGVLNAGIAAETNARAAADNAEALARSNEDAALNAAIGAEAQARATEDGNLNNSIASFIAAFGLASGAAGWFKSANGWIFQWGVGQTNGELNVNFPTTFPNACAVVLAGEGDASGWIVNGTVNPTVHAPTNKTSSGCTLVSAVIDSGGATALATGAALYYIAIGF